MVSPSRSASIENLLLAVSTLLLVVGIFLPGGSLYESVDYLLFYGPGFQFLMDELRAGRVPLWNPFIGLGRPFLADIQNAVFYPPIYFILIFGKSAGLFLLVYCHYVFAAFSMRRLGRELGMGRIATWLSVFALLFCAEVTGRFLAGQILFACAVCYLPALFVCCLRISPRANPRLMACYVLLLALQFLCGHPQVFWIAFLGQIAFVIGRNLDGPWKQTLPALGKELLQLLVAGVWCAAVVAAVLLPFFTLIAEGNRSAPSADFVNYGPLQWLDLFSLFADPPYAQQVNWETNVFIGLAVLIPGILGLTHVADRNVRGLLFVVIFALILALGANTPFFYGFYEWLPGFKGFRLHARAGILISFGLIAAAGLWLSRGRYSRGDIAGLLVVGLGLSALILRFYPFSYVEKASITWSRQIFFALIVLSILGTFLLLRWRNSSLATVALAALCAGQLLDAANAAFRLRGAYSFFSMMQTSPAYPYQKAAVDMLRGANLLAEDKPPPRVSIPSSIAPANYAMRDRYSNFDAYTSLFLRRPWSYLHRMSGVEAPLKKNTSVANGIYRKGPFPYAQLSLDLGFDLRSRRFVLNASPTPRAFVVYQNLQVRDENEAISLLRGGADIGAISISEQPIALRRSERASAPARITRFLPNQIEIELDPGPEGILVLAESWYPGWRSEIDGKVRNAFPVNAWMRGFLVPAGANHVRIYYREKNLIGGALISLAGLGLIIWTLTRSARKSMARSECLVQLPQTPG